MVIFQEYSGHLSHSGLYLWYWIIPNRFEAFCMDWPVLDSSGLLSRDISNLGHLCRTKISCPSNRTTFELNSRINRLPLWCLARIEFFTSFLRWLTFRLMAFWRGIYLTGAWLHSYPLPTHMDFWSWLYILEQMEWTYWLGYWKKIFLIFFTKYQVRRKNFQRDGGHTTGSGERILGRARGPRGEI